MTSHDERPLKVYICRPGGCGPCIREYAEPPTECCVERRVPGWITRPEWYELVPVRRDA